jgi:hypothetical protein
MSEAIYPLAPDGIYRSFQGEGDMLGQPTVFIRLAGCSVGCPLCDTDYRVRERLSARMIAHTALCVADGARWAWITGGEPTDHDLRPLVAELRSTGLSIALATSGVRELSSRWSFFGVDFLSVSPHDPAKWLLRSGQELKICPGLNGFGWRDFLPGIASSAFGSHWAMPCEGDAGSLAACKELCGADRRFRLGIQSHKTWGVA